MVNTGITTGTTITTLERESSPQAAGQRLQSSLMRFQSSNGVGNSREDEGNAFILPCLTPEGSS